MSEDSKYDTLFAKIAALESALAEAKRAPAQPQFDMNKFTAALRRNPIGVLSKIGVDPNAIAPAIVAHQLGDQAAQYPQLQALVNQGPLDAKVDEVSQLVAELRQWKQQTEDTSRQAGIAQSFKTLAADKSKYPHIAALAASDPSFFDGDIAGHKGDAATLAQTLESRYAVMAKTFGSPTGSQNQPDTAQSANTSEQRAAHTVGIAGGNPPPLPASSSGAPSEQELRALRDEVVRGVDAGRYGR